MQARNFPGQVLPVDLVVGHNLFDVYRRRNFVESHLMRIDELNPFSRMEPQPTVAGLRDRRTEVERNRAEPHTVRCVPTRRLNPARRIGDPRFQLAPCDAYQTTDRVQPQRTVVVFHRPMNGVAGQAVLRGERSNSAVFDAAKAPLRSSPHGSFPVDSQTRDMALTQALSDGVRRADLTILEIHHAAVRPECKPNSTMITENHLRLL